MSNSNSTQPFAPGNPWRLLWFRPREAVRAALAGEQELVQSVIVAVASVLFIAPLLGGFTQLFAATADAAMAGLIFLCAAAIGVVSLYVTAILIVFVARALGGEGSAKATRAALVWATLPALVPTVISSFLPRTSENPWIVIIVAVCVLAGAIWSFILVAVMLSEVQGFGRIRAIVSYVGGDIIPALALASIIRILLYQPFFAPSGSMIPTLHRGENFFVSKFAYGYSRYSVPFAPPLFQGRIFAREPKRGDVIVFHEGQTGADWIKRVVGLPGDKVQMIKGRLYINGELVPRTPIEPRAKVESRDGKIVEAPTYQEALPGGGAHKIIEIEGDNGLNDDTKLFITPQGSYFVLGDNRDNSSDSRIAPEFGGVGFVPFESLIGRAEVIFLSNVEAKENGRARLHLEWIDSAAAAAAR